MYTRFYQLSREPFNVTPDPEFLFQSPSHKKALASIINGVENGKDFVAITGEVGVGKTCIIHSYLEKANKAKLKIIYIVNANISFEAFLQKIYHALGLNPDIDDSIQMINHLHSVMIQEYNQGHKLVIIIDEAQSMPMKTLKNLQMLSNVETSTNKLIQIIMVGQPEFERILNQKELRQLKQRIATHCTITPLTEKESIGYIQFRLGKVTRNNTSVFTGRAIKKIVKQAKGIPRVINIICDNALLMGYSLSQRKIDVDIIRQVIKDNEGPRSAKTILATMTTALREVRPFPVRLELLSKRASLAILSLLCLGGVMFLTQGYLQRRPTKTWNVESSKSVHVDTHPSSTSAFPQDTKESNLKGESPRASTIAPKFPQPVSLLFASEPSASELGQLKDVTVKEGESLSYLAQKYYGRTNTTLATFILDYNPEITNADLIQVNQKIKIPKITEELLITQSADYTYKIHVGTFENAGFVRVYRSETTLKGKDIKIFRRKVSPQRSWYQVMVGTFDHKDECLKVVDKLKEKGLLPAFGGILKTESTAPWGHPTSHQ